MAIQAFLISFFFIFGFLLPSSTIAENIIVSRPIIKIPGGTSLVSSESLVIKGGATFDNSGALIIKKNHTNENAFSNSIGTGSVEFSNTNNQAINGDNIIQNLPVNDSTELTIWGKKRVNGNLILTNGKVVLGNINLLIGPSAIIAGTPSASVMIIVSVSAELRKKFHAGFTGTFIYPVGDDNGTPKYAPVTLIFNSGIFAPGNFTGVTLKSEKSSDPGITGNYPNRYWNISQSGITNMSCNATFQYLQEDIIFAENKLSSIWVNPLTWMTFAQTNTVSHLLFATKLNTSGSFSGLKSMATSTHKQLANVVIPSGLNSCYDAKQGMTVAGGGYTFLIESGGNVNLVAGSKVLLEYGTMLNNGGSLLVRITTNGIYCGAAQNPLVANLENKEALNFEIIVRNQFIKGYPNPTSDFIFVELLGTSIPQSAYVRSTTCRVEHSIKMKIGVKQNPILALKQAC